MNWLYPPWLYIKPAAPLSAIDAKVTWLAERPSFKSSQVVGKESGRTKNRTQKCLESDDFLKSGSDAFISLSVNMNPV